MISNSCNYLSVPLNKGCLGWLLQIKSHQKLSLLWRHNGRNDVSNHQPHDCLLNRLFGRRLKKISTLRVTDLCVGNSPVTGEFPAQMAINAEPVSILWHHHEIWNCLCGSIWDCCWDYYIIVVSDMVCLLFGKYPLDHLISTYAKYTCMSVEN